jgi:endonuclease/exonuclease/phosphatase family metal-dependent hydrolase
MQGFRHRMRSRIRGYTRLVLRPRIAAAAALTIGSLMFAGAESTAYAVGDSGGAADDQIFRVMSFNIHHAQGTDGVLDVPRIATVIRTQRPDVVGLQEVDRHWSDRSAFEDQAARLARLLDMHVVYGANLDLDPPAEDLPRRQYGTAILSRYPILTWENTLLPRFGDHEQRGLLRALINVRGGPVQVYNTHLQHNDAAERLEQAKAIVELIGTPEEPVILTGDLNAPPEAPEIAPLTELLRDAWSGPGGYTHPSEQPTHRIDYVLGSRDLAPRRAAVITSDAAASDHLPVVADYAPPPLGPETS